ncbi:MAG: arcB 1 [Gammaproteobacteria bacterium]|jgi:signal transduction histidine kinase|nr:arcB 1 [Gammaproteobacteria bacterium]
MKSDQEVTDEETGINERGEIAYYLSKKIPLKNKSKQVIGIIGTSIDITEQKKLNQLTEEFLKNAMHDIRTPFVGVVGMAEFLWRQEEDEVKKEYLGNIMESAKKLLDYNNELLDFSKNSAYFDNSKTKFNYKQIIKEIITMNIPAIKMKNIEVKTAFSSKSDFFIGNASAFKRILINLIGNAVKFTKSGHIKIILLAEKQSNYQALIKLIIEDSGIGISQDKKEIIFKKFVRLNPSYTGLYSGWGLGLAMVKQLVEIMEGTIEVQSEIGKGSTFICTLPLGISENNVDALKGKPPLLSISEKF